MDNQVNKIFAPNIYLFAYSLTDGAEGSKNPLWQAADKIINCFFQGENITDKLIFPDDSNNDNRTYLLKDDSLNFTSTQNPEIEGFAQPQKIQDCYALWFNIGYSDADETVGDVEVEVLQKFNPNHILILPKSDKILGQTLLITAWLTNKTKQRDRKYLRNLADQCCQTLLGDKTPPFSRAGELFDSAIFEYGNPKQDSQVLVWLFRDETADQQYDQYQQELIILFLYRAKITKAFQASRLIYKALNQAYSEIEENLDRIQQKLDTSNPNHTYLDDFKTQLKTLARKSLSYTRLLRKMEDFGNTIEINLYNYNETIQKICGKLEIDKEELSFLKYFGQETAPHFQRQIKADLGYFEHGTDLIEQAIASIRGIVEIDQAERDRQRQETEQTKQKQQEKANQDLQDLIQAVGVGIAAGAIVASTSGLITQPWSFPGRDRIFLPPHPFVIALVASVLCSVGAFWLAKQAIKRKRKRSQFNS
ncbi:hypothetical protein [Floridanema evergladense]|uniref:Uncharacterized protein n=1 Tax=Floridaenema evergladense BLCC-F167 TaxID=3153639 RepID=A0ABV4WN06_9CYAN